MAWSIPTVAGLDVGLFRDGDQVEVDGELGRVQLPEVELRAVVTVFLQRGDGRLLLLRRSGKVGTFQGRWAAVSGFLEDPTPLAQAVREVSEETGLDVGGRPPAASAPPLYVRDGREMFVVHAFRFPVGEVEPRLDWEHTAFEWVSPEEIARRPTVPQLDRAWRSVAPR